MVRDTIIQKKGQPTELEKVYTNYISNRGFLSKIYKELKGGIYYRINFPLKFEQCTD